MKTEHPLTKNINKTLERPTNKRTVSKKQNGGAQKAELTINTATKTNRATSGKENRAPPNNRH